MSIRNAPEGLVLVIQRRVAGTEMHACARSHGQEGRVWLDCANGPIKGYRADQRSQCLIDLQAMAEKYPHFDYRVMQCVDYISPSKATFKAR